MATCHWHFDRGCSWSNDSLASADGNGRSDERCVNPMMPIVTENQPITRSMRIKTWIPLINVACRDKLLTKYYSLYEFIMTTFAEHLDELYIDWFVSSSINACCRSKIIKVMVPSTQETYHLSSQKRRGQCFIPFYQHAFKMIYFYRYIFLNWDEIHMRIIYIL